MDGREPGGQRACVVQKRHRRAAVERLARLVLRGLLRQVRVHGLTVARGEHLTDLVASDGPHRMDGGADARRFVVGKQGVSRGPGGRGTVAEALLVVAQRRVTVGGEPAVEVTGVEEREADPGLPGGLAERFAHRVRVVVRRAAGAMVDVVELGHARHAGHDHLGEDGARERAVVLWREAPRDGVHALAPRPEGAAVAVGTSAQRAVERV